MGHARKIEEYPHLQSWYLSRQMQPPMPTDHVSMLVWSTCRALSQDEPKLLNTWCEGLRSFFDNTSEAYQDFIKAEQTLATGGLDFMNFATEVAELAVRIEKGDQYLSLMKEVADKCELPVFRFLAAWTALNTGKLEECIEECEKVDDPFSCVHTLLGQALLETGQPDAAIDSLLVSTRLAPDEILAHFQLAKAYHATDDNHAAWKALQACDRLAPNNPEIAAFFSLIAESDEECEFAWNSLSFFIKREECTAYIIGLMLNLCFRQKSKFKLQFLLDNAPWHSLKTDKEFVANIAWILKKFEELGWNNYSRILLQNIT